MAMLTVCLRTLPSPWVLIHGAEPCWTIDREVLMQEAGCSRILWTSKFMDAFCIYFFFKEFYFVFVCLYVCMQVPAEARQDMGCLDLELQAVVSLLTPQNNKSS